MKKTKIFMMLTAVVLLSSCMSDDATDTYKDFINNWGNNGNGTITSASGELSTFEVAIDKETAEPTDVATATYPEASDAISTQQFTKMVTIDLPRSSFEGWDAKTNTMRVVPGRYELMVGNSSADKDLKKIYLTLH